MEVEEFIDVTWLESSALPETVEDMGWGCAQSHKTGISIALILQMLNYIGDRGVVEGILQDTQKSLCLRPGDSITLRGKLLAPEIVGYLDKGVDDYLDTLPVESVEYVPISMSKEPGLAAALTSPGG